jgi:putative transposase
MIYVLVRCLLGCVLVTARREASKDAELLVLRHQNAVLRRQVRQVRRVRCQPTDRLWLAALSRVIPRRRWAEVFAVTPATLLAWHLSVPRITSTALTSRVAHPALRR